MEEKINNKSFVAIDFEYATNNKGSICSVGIVTFENGQISEEFSTFVRPPNNEYKWENTSIHKINSLKTENSPDFKTIYPEIKKRIENKIVVAHGAFHTDKICLQEAMNFYEIFDDLNIEWVCTQKILNCSLNIAADACSISFDHHNPISDAKTCGLLYLKFLDNDIPFFDIINAKVENPKVNKIGYHESLKGEVLKPDLTNAINKTNPFYNKKVVITGFENDLKKHLAIKLKELGADINTAVSVRTNYLIAGDTAGPSKLKKMQENISSGLDSYIIDLDKFNSMIAD